MNTLGLTVIWMILVVLAFSFAIGKMLTTGLNSISNPAEETNLTSEAAVAILATVRKVISGISMSISNQEIFQSGQYMYKLQTKRHILIILFFQPYEGVATS